MTLPLQTDNTKKLHDYHLVKNMNSAFNNIIVAAIGNQWVKGSKNIVVGYANKSFVELMEWIYVSYGQITPGYLMRNQEKIQRQHITLNIQ